MIRYQIDRARENNLCRIFPTGAVSPGRRGEGMCEFGDMVEAGAVGFTDDGSWVRDGGLMSNALKYAGMLGVPVITHAEDQTINGSGVMHAGYWAARLGLSGAPLAEGSLLWAADTDETPEQLALRLGRDRGTRQRQCQHAVESSLRFSPFPRRPRVSTFGFRVKIPESTSDQILTRRQFFYPDPENIQNTAASSAPLLHATERSILCTSRHFQPGQAASLGNRPAGKQPVEIFHSSIDMKPFIQRIMQFTHVEVGLVMRSEVSLQCVHYINMGIGEFKTLFCRRLPGAVYTPSRRCI